MENHQTNTAAVHRMLLSMLAARLAPAEAASCQVASGPGPDASDELYLELAARGWEGAGAPPWVDLEIRHAAGRYQLVAHLPTEYESQPRESIDAAVEDYLDWFERLVRVAANPLAQRLQAAEQRLVELERALCAEQAESERLRARLSKKRDDGKQLALFGGVGA